MPPHWRPADCHEIQYDAIYAVRDTRQKSTAESAPERVYTSRQAPVTADYSAWHVTKSAITQETQLAQREKAIAHINQEWSPRIKVRKGNTCPLTFHQKYLSNTQNPHYTLKLQGWTTSQTRRCLMWMYHGKVTSYPDTSSQDQDSPERRHSGNGWKVPRKHSRC